jgi:hypothetical protein
LLFETQVSHRGDHAKTSTESAPPSVSSFCYNNLNLTRLLELAIHLSIDIQPWKRESEKIQKDFVLQINCFRAVVNV